jgi:two-component system, cell cycle sensor histidine kinase PleC
MISDIGEINFQVSDSGEGMTANDIKRVQEPFVRLQGAVTSSEEGTGLGLAITKRLTEIHGGRLQLHSETSVGTTAIVIFPKERTAKALASQNRH